MATPFKYWIDGAPVPIDDGGPVTFKYWGDGSPVVEAQGGAPVVDETIFISLAFDDDDILA